MADKKKKDRKITIEYNGRHYVLKAGDTMHLRINLVVEGDVDGTLVLKNQQLRVVSID